MTDDVAESHEIVLPDRIYEFCRCYAAMQAKPERSIEDLFAIAIKEWVRREVARRSVADELMERLMGRVS